MKLSIYTLQTDTRNESRFSASPDIASFENARVATIQAAIEERKIGDGYRRAGR